MTGVQIPPLALTSKVSTTKVVTHHEAPLKLEGRPMKTKKQLYRKFHGTCQICHKKVAWRKATVDHILPKDKGGTNHKYNLQLAHRTCNQAKANHNIDHRRREIRDKITQDLYQTKQLINPKRIHRHWFLHGQTVCFNWKQNQYLTQQYDQEWRRKMTPIINKLRQQLQAEVNQAQHIINTFDDQHPDMENTKDRYQQIGKITREYFPELHDLVQARLHPKDKNNINSKLQKQSRLKYQEGVL